MKRKTKASLGKLLMDGVRIAGEFLEPDPEREIRVHDDEPETTGSSASRRAELESRAFELRGEGAKLPTKLDQETQEPRIAWAEAASAQVKMEERFIAATSTFMLAVGMDASSSEQEVAALARTAALWWHGQTEGDVPKS